MRLDKYLKVSRIIKRRTLAKELCDAGKVNVNGKVARASLEVKIGDILDMNMGAKNFKAKIVNVCQHCKKEDANTMYEIIN